jgi:hypothetical protein
LLECPCAFSLVNKRPFLQRQSVFWINTPGMAQSAVLLIQTPITHQISVQIATRRSRVVSGYGQSFDISGHHIGGMAIGPSALPHNVFCALLLRMPAAAWSPARSMRKWSPSWRHRVTSGLGSIASSSEGATGTAGTSRWTWTERRPAPAGPHPPSRRSVRHRPAWLDRQVIRYVANRPCPVPFIPIP